MLSFRSTSAQICWAEEWTGDAILNWPSEHRWSGNQLLDSSREERLQTPGVQHGEEGTAQIPSAWSSQLWQTPVRPNSKRQFCVKEFHLKLGSLLGRVREVHIPSNCSHQSENALLMRDERRMRKVLKGTRPATCVHTKTNPNRLIGTWGWKTDSKVGWHPLGLTD